MTDHTDLLDRLEAAREERARKQAQVEEIGEDRLRELQAAHDDLTALLGRYEERATGSGDFQAFIEFQEALSELVADLSEDLPEREVFEAIDEDLQQRRLTTGDFEAARDRLSDVEALVARLDDRREAADRVKRLERRVREALHETHEEIDRLETVASLGEADLDAPVEDLKAPIEAYNDSVQSAFRRFKDAEPARAVLGLVKTADQFPLVDFAAPPEGLADFLASQAVGEEPIPTLVEYTTYSRSKLGHYVDSPSTFQRLVGGNRTYLERLDAEPLTVGWPPPDPDTLRWRANELVSMLNRFAPAETVAALDAIRALARDEDRYRRLRQAARARAELTPAERERLAEGAVTADLEDARASRSALEEALSR